MKKMNPTTAVKPKGAALHSPMGDKSDSFQGGEDADSDIDEAKQEVIDIMKNE